MIPPSAIALLCPTCGAPRLAADPSCKNCLQTRPEFGWDFDPDDGLRELIASNMTDRFVLGQVEDHCNGHVRYRAVDLDDNPHWVHLVGHPMDPSWTRSHAHLLRSAMEIEDPRIARIAERGVVGPGAFFLVFEGRTGPTLADLMADGPVEPRRTQNLLLEIVAALRVLHDNEIALWSLQPADVAIVESEHTESVFLPCIDVSMAGVARPPDPRFLAPELRAGDEVDGSADIYAVGAMLRAALGVADEVLQASPPLGLLADVLRQMTAAEPEDRPDPTRILDMLESNDIPDGPAAWLSASQDPEPEQADPLEYFLPPPDPMSEEARACAESLVDILDSSVPTSVPKRTELTLPKTSITPRATELEGPATLVPPPQHPRASTARALTTVALAAVALFAIRAVTTTAVSAEAPVPDDDPQLASVFPEAASEAEAPESPESLESSEAQVAVEQLAPVPEDAPEPSWIHELDGTWSGVASDKAMTLDIDFAPDGRVTATMSTKRLLSRPMTLRGTWSEKGDGAVVDLVEEGPKPARYVGTFTDSNGVGKVLAKNDRERGVWRVRR